MEHVELVRLSPAEVDDQAIAEIRQLAPYVRPAGPAMPAESLVDLVASGRAVVARRPCGMSPEIVGLAVASREGLRPILAVDPEIGGAAVETGLREALRAHQRPVFLFRPSRRPPLGLTHAPS